MVEDGQKGDCLGDARAGLSEQTDMRFSFWNNALIYPKKGLPAGDSAGTNIFSTKKKRVRINLTS